MSDYLEEDIKLQKMLRDYFSVIGELRDLVNDVGSLEEDKEQKRGEIELGKKEIMTHLSKEHNTILGLFLFFARSYTG